ncbi:MAG TPA: hypothetical protein VFI92_15695 [Steroidobacteraceae bacterium]|nr:hypothetical protein [Steroidobacteraceae bacterium]
MPRTYVCPCCDGQGLVPADSNEAEPLECAECDATGKVTKQHREELLAWRHECRLRRPRGERQESGQPDQT